MGGEEAFFAYERTFFRMRDCLKMLRTKEGSSVSSYERTFFRKNLRKKVVPYEEIHSYGRTFFHMKDFLLTEEPSSI